MDKANERVVTLLSDTTFKYLWKEKRFRPFLEKVILKVTGINLEGYHLIDNELNSGNNYKDYRLDILLKKENSIVNIEMNQYVEKYTSRKSHSYLYRIAGNMYEKGEEYEEYNVTQINFNNSYCEYDKDIGFSIYEFVDIEHDILINDIKSYEIYLARYKGICYNRENKKEKYLAMFTAKSYEEMRKYVGGESEALLVVDELEKLNRDKYFGALYDDEIVRKKEMNTIRNEGYEEGVEKGIKQGIKQGIEEGTLSKSREIAKSMLKKDIDISIIIECTGLTEEELSSLNPIK